MRSILWVWTKISTITGNALFENKPIRNICIKYRRCYIRQFKAALTGVHNLNSSNIIMVIKLNMTTAVHDLH